MSAYLLRRCLLAVLTLFIVTVGVYALVRSIPGDPLAFDSESGGKKVNQDDIKRKRAIYGLDDPIYVGYVKWLTNVARGELGNSLTKNYTVAEEIGDRLGPTLQLSITSLVLAYLLSIPLGIYVSARAGKPDERAISTSLYMLYSLPAFVAAMLLQSFFSIQLEGTAFELPLYGRQSDDYAALSLAGQLWDRIRHMILPTFCFTYGALAYECRFIQANMAEVIRQDYIRTARAKGVDETTVLVKHAFRNTLIPFVTLLGLTFPTLLSGAVILEQIFSWPGMGQLLIESIRSLDFPVIMALVTMFSILTLLGQLLADIAYAFVDPRIVYK